MINRLLALIVILAVVGCAGPTATPVATPVSLASTTLELPGTHLALTEGAPSGFDVRPIVRVYTLHQSGQDIWLYAPADNLRTVDVDGKLLAWLKAIDALHFPNNGRDLYWIPADAEVDRLAFADTHQLSEAVAPDQLAGLWFHHGNALRRERNFPDAIAAYRHSITLDPNNGLSYIGLGAALVGLGRTDEAVAALQQGLVYEPNDFWGHRLLGNSYLKLQRYALAADELTQAYVIDPSDPHLLIGIALGQGRGGQRELALLTLDQFFARSDNPEHRADAELLRQEFTQTSP